MLRKAFAQAKMKKRNRRDTAIKIIMTPFIIEEDKKSTCPVGRRPMVFFPALDQ